MHEIVRKDIWGYALNEELSNEELIKESYQGIRPAPGYPACPDHRSSVRHVRSTQGRCEHVPPGSNFDHVFPIGGA